MEETWSAFCTSIAIFVVFLSNGNHYLFRKYALKKKKVLISTSILTQNHFSALIILWEANICAQNTERLAHATP